MTLTDTDLKAKLADVEDNFVERKSKSARGGWLRQAAGNGPTLRAGLMYA